MKIAASSLGACSVAKGGDRISLGFVDDEGKDIEICVAAADACAIAMTLPRLLKDSLTEKYRDPALRYVFPLDMWQVEAASDGAQMIMTFSTGGGFEVSFSAKPDWGRSLAMALMEGTEERLTTARPAAN